MRFVPPVPIAPMAEGVIVGVPATSPVSRRLAGPIAALWPWPWAGAVAGPMARPLLSGSGRG